MHLEPGERFTIEYGNSHQISVVALSARAKRRLVAMIKEIQTLQPQGVDGLERLYELAEEGVKVCVPDITDAQLEAMDEQQQLEIVGKTLAGASPTEEQQKKLESPPS
jgi:hypothetical protein